MKCYFLRHGAAAESADWPGEDFDRPLTAAGRERMAGEAKAMARLSLHLEVIVTSPLVRAKQTAEIVAKALQLRDRLVEDDRLGLGFDPRRLASILVERAGAGAIMLVGHEPGMSTTIGHIVGGARIDFKKGSLACVSVHDPSTPHGELLWLVPPSVLAPAKGKR
jgi:phosphohistidine phosphatase